MKLKKNNFNYIKRFKIKNSNYKNEDQNWHKNINKLKRKINLTKGQTK